VPRPLADSVSALEQLAEEVRILERRVLALETKVPAAEPAPAWPEIKPPDWLSTGLVPVLGTAILGIGGAYLLRALAESGTLPQLAVVAVAVGYATLWLLQSARMRSCREPACVVYAATAGLILLPMLWETTVRFKVLEPGTAVGLLIAFVVAGAALAWVRDRAALLWVTALPAAVATMALLISTGQVTPFTIALLAIAAVVEGVAVRDRCAGLRPAAALFADAGVWLMLYVGTQAQAPGAYRPAAHAVAVALAFALLGIYAVSAGWRAVWLRRRITLLDAGQTAAACFLAIAGTLRLAESHAALGIFCLLLAAACYFAAFTRASEPRNQHVFGGYGLALLLAGSALLLPAPLVALAWPGIAVAGMFAAARILSPMLAMNAAVCLAAGAWVSGLFEYGWRAMTAASLPGLAGFPWVTAVAAALCYAASPTGLKWVRLVAASLAAFAAIAFAAAVCGSPSAAWLAAIRTLVLCAAALLCGGTGARWNRRELVSVGYAAIALATLKLFLEDFHQDSPAALAIALLAYGTVLILTPRLTRRARAT
jgi:hypothetical protein